MHNAVIELAWQDYFAENNRSYLTEELAPNNMNTHDMANLLIKALVAMGSEQNPLTIVDPYIFPPKHDSDYKDLLVDIIKKAKASSVIFIAKRECKACYSSELRCCVEKELADTHVPVTVKECSPHERWWIVNDKVLVVGASLNGFGHGYPVSMNLMNENDAKSAINDLNTVSTTL
jgi:hypothetical protein